MDSIQKKQYNRLRIFYFFYFAGFGSFWPYIALFYDRLGFDGHQIGLLTATGSLVLLLTQPLWGILCDKFKSRHFLLSFAIFMAVLITLLFLWANNLYIFLLLMSCLVFFAFPIVPMVDTLSMRFAKSIRLSYGSIRVWGSIGFCIMVLLVGQLAHYPYFGRFYAKFHPDLSYAILSELRGMPVLFLVYSFIMMIVLLVSFKLPKSYQTGKSNFQGGFGDLLKNRRFAAFLFCVFLLMTSTAGNSTYFSIYFDQLNGQTGLLGIALTIASASEIPIFLYATKIFRRFNPLILLSAAGFFGAIRWFALSLISDPLMVLWIQPLHAINFGCFYLGAIYFVDAETPLQWKTTGQTLFWAVGFGLAAITGNYFGGLVYEHSGIITLYQLGAFIALISGILFYLIEKYIPRKNIINRTGGEILPMQSLN